MCLAKASVGKAVRFQNSNKRQIPIVRQDVTAIRSSTQPVIEFRRLRFLLGWRFFLLAGQERADGRTDRKEQGQQDR